mmetsp:Transcript_47/g.168  ORF Transcript_47/g.168 Transcript_47/m.168 type:complete len:136 (+) Transcript_47:112-519(+)
MEKMPFGAKELEGPLKDRMTVPLSVSLLCVHLSDFLSSSLPLCLWVMCVTPVSFLSQQQTDRQTLCLLTEYIHAPTRLDSCTPTWPVHLSREKIGVTRCCSFFPSFRPFLHPSVHPIFHLCPSAYVCVFLFGGKG